VRHVNRIPSLFDLPSPDTMLRNSMTNVRRPMMIITNRRLIVCERLSVVVLTFIKQALTELDIAHCVQKTSGTVMCLSAQNSRRSDVNAYRNDSESPGPQRVSRSIRPCSNVDAASSYLPCSQYAKPKFAVGNAKYCKSNSGNAL
jgi:hypothetical protein